jgi:hypothetical protein
MLTVAYLANQFPSEVEPYVGQEIEELRARRVEVVCGSVRKPEGEIPDIVVQNAGAGVLARAIWLCLTHFRSLVPLLASIFTSGHESFAQQFKALLHTLLGAVYAVLLRGREVDHIHVHHGYFASWIGLTAARLLKIGFSMTLHGSDLLLNGRYLEIKLANCDFCITISEYNRNYAKLPGSRCAKYRGIAFGGRLTGAYVHSNLAYGKRTAATACRRTVARSKRPWILAPRLCGLDEARHSVSLPNSR